MYEYKAYSAGRTTSARSLKMGRPCEWQGLEVGKYMALCYFWWLINAFWYDPTISPATIALSIGMRREGTRLLGSREPLPLLFHIVNHDRPQGRLLVNGRAPSTPLKTTTLSSWLRRIIRMSTTISPLPNLRSLAWDLALERGIASDDIVTLSVTGPRQRSLISTTDANASKRATSHLSSSDAKIFDRTLEQAHSRLMLALRWT